MWLLWKTWARARAAARWDGDVPGEAPQLDDVSDTYYGCERLGRIIQNADYSVRGAIGDRYVALLLDLMVIAIL